MAVRLTFGDRASPYLVQSVVRSHAQDFAKKYPTAASVLLEDMYKDDILHSEETVEDAVLVRIDLTKVLGSAGFHAQKWYSNRTEVLKEIPEMDRVIGVKLEDSELPSVKTLVSVGMRVKMFSPLFSRKSTCPFTRSEAC